VPVDPRRLDDPVAALQLLRHVGFSGRKLLSPKGFATTLHYRRRWRGIADVVLVYGPDDAEAYRAADFIDDHDPFEVAYREDLIEEVFGTVSEVVAAIVTWPNPPAWANHFQPAPSDDRAPTSGGRHASS
jgi:hypothetical protein